MMVSRVRIPFLVNVVRVRRAEDIRRLATADVLDRQFKPGGPLINRAIAGRLRRTLAAGGARLPSSLPRDDAGRQEAQRALAAQLGPHAIADILARPVVAALALRVSGGPGRPVGMLVQEFSGLLFKENYAADDTTWAAAVTLDAALRSNNPLRRLVWLMTGGVRRAQRTLADAAGGDLSGVHATGVAVHTLARSVENLAMLFRDPFLRASLSPQAAVARALDAPDKVVRQATGGDLPRVGAVTPGTLVVFETRIAGRASLDPAVIFLSESWSYCPAHGLVPALLHHLWAEAVAADSNRDATRTGELRAGGTGT